MALGEYDVVIVGCGPGGSSTALFLANKGYKVLVLEKKKFPRDKICGDAVGGKSVKILRELGLLEKYESDEHFDINGVIFSSPNGTILKIDTKKNGENKKPSGYIVRRYIGDNHLFSAVKEKCEVIEEANVVDVINENGQIKGVKAEIKGKVEEIKAKIVVAADGAGSTIASKVNAEKIEDEHHVIALRQYWQGVEGLEDKIELHFMEDVLPGYFWIFPLPNKMANVGLGMLTKHVKERRINLKEMLEKSIKNKLVAHRFVNAKPLEDPKGWGLPLGSKRRKGYGNGYLLVGDACCLIDPFTGEGVGNALLSGKLASIAIDEAFKKNDFSSNTLKLYDELLKKHLDDELQTMYKLQRLGRFKFLIDLVISKASRNEELKQFITSTLIEQHALDYRKKMLSPMFWLKVLIS